MSSIRKIGILIKTFAIDFYYNFTAQLLLQMALIFNEKGLKDVSPPCVAQTFVPHGAVLFKLYVLGDQFSVVERPSLKNFKACGKIASP